MGRNSDGLVVSLALREQLLQLATLVSKPKGATLFRRGDACAGAFLICSGRVCLSLQPVHPSFPPRVLGAGCLIGLPAAVAGSEYSLTAEVSEPAELACVSRDALSDCLRQNSELCLEVMKILSHEISATRAAIKQGTVRPRN